MIRIRLLPLLAGALLFGLAASAWAQTDVAKTASDGDRAFMQKAAGAGVTEVQLAQLALTKSDNHDVKALAQRIVDDHTAANAKLKAIAGQQQVTLTTQPDAAAQKEASRLRALDGAVFDQAWAKAMVDDHKKVVKLFRTENKAATDDDLRAFASATLPVLQAHLKSAQHLVALPTARDEAMKSAMSADLTPAHQTPAQPASSAVTPSTAPTSSLPTGATSTRRPGL